MLLDFNLSDLEMSTVKVIQSDSSLVIMQVKKSLYVNDIKDGNGYNFGGNGWP